jgi:hypothetical protein
MGHELNIGGQILPPPPAMYMKSLTDLGVTSELRRETDVSKSDSNINIVLKKTKNRRIFR